jgi:iron complex outermembrane receptor protein
MTTTSDTRPGSARTRTRKTTLAGAVSAAVVASSLSAPAASQVLEEVIVTATKRAESVQDVPLAITALSGEFINKVNLTDVKDLVTFTPGVSGNSQDSFIDGISVCGIRTQDFGVGLDPSAAFFKNDLYEGRNGSAVTTLYDLERAEILRGPQGFLFGRNSIGGAFSVHTRRAEIGSTDGYIEAEAAERDTYRTQGAVNIPVSNNFAARVAGFYSTEDGFVDNLNGGDDLIEHNNWGARLSTTFETDKLGVYAFAEYEDRNQSGSVYRAVTEGRAWEALEAALGPIEVRGSDDDTEADVDLSGGDDDNSDIITLGLRVDYDLGFATLTSNTGYKDHDYYYNEDYDGTALNLETYRQDQTGDYFQQELRLTSQTEGPLSWYAGASYYQEDIEAKYRFAGEEELYCEYYGYAYYGLDPSSCADLFDYYGYEWYPSSNGLLEETGKIVGDYEGWAAYLNLAYNITETIQVEGGVRYTDDEKTFSHNIPVPDSELGPYWAWQYSTDGKVEDDESWDELTPRFIVRWMPTETALLFASYTAGYKSGGFSTFSLNPTPEFGQTDIRQGDGFGPDTVDPEEVDSYEIGYKDTIFGGNANFDLVAFYYEYTDLQVTVGTEGGPTLTKNAGEVEAWGVEGSITSALGDHWTAYVTLGYLDSEATDIQDICGWTDPETGEADPERCENNRLYQAPEWSGSLVLNANYPVGGGAITANYELTWESERGGGCEDYSYTKIDSSEEMSLRIAYESDDNWFVEGYVENMTDEFTWDGQNNLGGKEPDIFFGPRKPRTYGMRLGYSWD